MSWSWIDPQGNATTGLGIEARNFDASMYDVLLHDMSLEDCMVATSIKNLFVAPATIDLAGAEIELVPAFSRELRLRRAIDAIRDDFDFIFMDCPPSLGLITVNGLAAASEVIVPIQCEYYALEGLGQLLRNVELVRATSIQRLRFRRLCSPCLMRGPSLRNRSLMKCASTSGRSCVAGCHSTVCEDLGSTIIRGASYRPRSLIPRSDRVPRPGEGGFRRCDVMVLAADSSVLIPAEAHIDSTSVFREVPLAFIQPNRYQPCTHFDEESLSGLVDSIRAVGVIQPVLVRQVSEEQFALIAGERRCRAARRAGLQSIPALVQTIDDLASLERAPSRTFNGASRILSTRRPRISS